ncbi:hypothetical protein F5Y17DRAFT_129231 [Xylariaceae sp. FL0594]|nr:hypothetical protein F5Y17DRAFT_129231 [Xylariaceae sp. FL0594]
MQRGASSTSEEPGPGPGSPSTTSMAAQGIIAQEHEDGDGRKGPKRELSQSKRAAQNRAAQRAFRQRKEHYIKKLEQQVREYGELELTWKAIQNDNYALREYIIQLQSRLLDLQVEFPQPPPNINLASPTVLSTGRQPHANNLAGDAGTLADVAAAVTGLNRDTAGEAGYGKTTFKTENTMPHHNSEESRRQISSTTLPPPSSLRT